MKKSLKDLIIFIFVGGLTRLIPILFYPVVIQFYSQAEFGLFTLFNLYISLGSTLLLLGMEQALFRFLPTGEEADKKKYIAATTLSLVLTILAFLIYVLFKTYLDGLLFDQSIGSESLWLFPLLLLANLSAVSIVILKSEQKTERYLLLNTVRMVIYVAVFFSALYLGLKLEAFFLAFALSEFIVVALSFDRIKNLFLQKPDFLILKKMLHYGIPLMGTALLTLVLYQADHYMIKYFIDIETTGIYHFGYKFAAILGTLVLLANSAWAARLFEQGEQFSKRLFTDYSSTLTYLNGIMLIIIHLLFSCFGELFLPEEYSLSIEIFKVLSLGYLFFAHYQILDTIILYKKRTKVLLLISLATLTLNISFNYYFIPVYGILSAAIITTASFLFQWLCIVLYLKFFEETSYINTSLYKFIAYMINMILVILFLNTAFSIILLIVSILLVLKSEFIRSIYSKDKG